MENTINYRFTKHIVMSRLQKTDNDTDNLVWGNIPSTCVTTEIFVLPHLFMSQRCTFPQFTVSRNCQHVGTSVFPPQLHWTLPHLATKGSGATLVHKSFDWLTLQTIESSCCLVWKTGEMAQRFPEPPETYRVVQQTGVSDNIRQSATLFADIQLQEDVYINFQGTTASI